MKKGIFSFIFRLLLVCLACIATARLFLEWTGYFENDAYVAYLYQDTTFDLVEISQMTELFAENDVLFRSVPLYGDTVDRVSDQIEQGANTIILNLEESPTDALIALAAEYNVTLFFVGVLPSDTQYASYDKIWGYAHSPAYAGELLGELVALGFREDTITDKNDDILLDYVFYNANDTYMDTETAVETTLLELDHYGVYTTDVYAAAYSVASAAAELAAANAAAAALGEDGTEVAEGEGADESAASTDGADTDDAATEAEADESAEGAEGAKAEANADETDAAQEVTVLLSDLTQPEVAMAIGSANASYLAQQAIALGWRDYAATETALACIVENYAAAQALAETGLYHSIVYFDTAAATETMVAMACNAWEQTPVTNGTDYAEPADKTFVISHKVYALG